MLKFLLFLVALSWFAYGTALMWWLHPLYSFSSLVAFLLSVEWKVRR